MLNVMMTVDNKMITLDNKDIRKGCWVNLVAPDDRELELVSQMCGVTLDILKVALDDEERAHIEREDGSTLIVIDTPVIEEDDKGDYQYTTLPLGIIFNNEYFITVSLDECGVVSDFVEGRVKGFFTFKRIRNMLLLLQRNSTKFLQYLKQIDKSSARVQTELEKSMKNKEILQMMELEKSLVYFATGINANEYVLEKIITFEEIKTYPEDVELVADVITENKQAMEMCSIYSDITSGQMDAFASLVSNNLSIIMKTFTMITIIMAIPTLLFSAWGMNVNVPFVNEEWGFWIVIGISILCVLGGIFALVKLNGMPLSRTRKSSSKDSSKNRRRK